MELRGRQASRSRSRPIAGATARLFYQRLSDQAICYQDTADGVAWSDEQVAATPATNAWALASGSIFHVYAALNHSAGDQSKQDVVEYLWAGGLGWSGPQVWTNPPVQISGPQLRHDRLRRPPRDGHTHARRRISVLRDDDAGGRILDDADPRSSARRSHPWHQLPTSKPVVLGRSVPRGRHALRLRGRDGGARRSIPSCGRRPTSPTGTSSS